MTSTGHDDSYPEFVILSFFLAINGCSFQTTLRESDPKWADLQAPDTGSCNKRFHFTEYKLKKKTN